MLQNETSVAHLVVDALISNGIDQLYCLPGVQNDDFFDALYDRQSELVPIHSRHEQGCAYMATGAAMATGKPQAFCVVPGPGFLNTTAALSTAYAVNAPVFSLVGQIPSGAIGKGFGILHEISDQLGTLKSLTKHAERVVGDNAEDVLREAFIELVSGRPRPVGVEVPVNVWNHNVAQSTAMRVEPRGNPAPLPENLELAIEQLKNARAPMIVVGSGALDHSEAITRLADAMSAPVACFRNGHGIVSDDNDLAIGMPVAHDLWDKVDVVIGLGTRLQTQQMQWGVDEDLTIIHVDIDADELGRINQPTVSIHASLDDVMPVLLSELENLNANRKIWLDTIAETKQGFSQTYADKLAPQLSWLQAIRQALPRDGIFVDELTQVGYVSRFTFPSYAPRTFLSTGYQGTLGYGLATALGAAHARRDVPVLSINGDGGGLYTINELATAVRHNIPITAIYFNDNAFGNVRRFQIENYNNRPIASDLASPDFVKLAESFGVKGLYAETPEKLIQQMESAFNDQGPTLIEVPVAEFPSPWPYVLMPKVRG